ALISVAFLYRLTLALTGSRPAALIAGLLVASNPLLAFFSKFPLSEVPALAFSAMAFTFLTFYGFSTPAARQPRWLFLAALAMLCLFTTRITGFLYLPFLILLSAFVLICDPDASRRAAVHRWTMGVVVLYAGSVVYGLERSSVYSRDVYRLGFRDLFGPGWKSMLLLCESVAVFGWLAIGVGSTRDGARRWLSRVAVGVRSVLGPALLVAVLLGGWKAYQLGFTTRYSGNAHLSRYHIVGTGWQGFSAWSLVVAAEFLCPLLLVAFLLLLLRRPHEPRIEVMVLFLAYFVVHFALLEWFVVYQPYFARYLASEFVPYALVFVVCCWVF